MIINDIFRSRMKGAVVAFAATLCASVSVGAQDSASATEALSPSALEDKGAVEISAHKVWTLKDCLDYAEQEGIDVALLKAQANQLHVDVMQQKGEWLPAVSASTSHSLNYSPFLKEQAGMNVDKVTYNGSYGVNANWTVWNGNQTANNIRLAKLAAEKGDMQSEIYLNRIKEQATQLYVQILYTQEALKVNRELLEQDKTLYSRGEALYELGQIARYELLELQAQVANGQYDIVSTETLLEQYKLQLKDLISLPGEIPFEVATVDVSDEQALAVVPSTESVYAKALATRPEVRESEISIRQSELNYTLAKAGYLPTVGLTAGMGSNHSSGNHNDYFEQMKRSFDASVGLSVSVPIMDKRRTKAAVQKADIGRTIAKLDLDDLTGDLYYTVANYRLQAVNNQQKFSSGITRVQYNQENYNAIYEKAHVGALNIVETFNARTSLLTARQDVLQSKYLTIYNMQMLRLYSGEEITL